MTLTKKRETHEKIGRERERERERKREKLINSKTQALT